MHRVYIIYAYKAYMCKKLLRGDYSHHMSLGFKIVISVSLPPV